MTDCRPSSKVGVGMPKDLSLTPEKYTWIGTLGAKRQELKKMGGSWEGSAVLVF